MKMKTDFYLVSSFDDLCAIASFNCAWNVQMIQQWRKEKIKIYGDMKSNIAISVHFNIRWSTMCENEVMVDR